MKKTIALILCFMFMLSVSGFAELADIAGHWAYDTIISWHGDGKIAGYPDNTFRPDRNVTNAEFIKLLAGAIGEPNVTGLTLPYTDCSENDWFYPYVKMLFAFSIIPVKEKLEPSVYITREEAATMIGKAYGIKNDEASIDFTDANSIKAEYAPYLVAMAEKGFMKGYTDNTIRPQGLLTRAEAITLLDRVSKANPKWTTPDIVKTYFVDAENGNDSNSGTSTNKAFATISAVNDVLRSNEKKVMVLFKRGQQYSGTLHIYGDVDIGAYGEGFDKPVLVGKGDNVISVKGGNVSITDIKITNPDGKRGIYINPSKTGACKDIIVKNCVFEEICYKVSKSNENYGTGGIIMEVGNNSPTWFDGVHIEDNAFDRVARSAVYMTTVWACRDPEQKWGNKNNYVDENSDWYPSYNVNVLDNEMTNIGGDVILLIGTKGALVQGNTAHHIKLMADNKGPIAGMWVHSSDDAIFRYNEVGYMKLLNGAGDGEAFDADISCRNCIFEYNFSHDNEGGFMLLCATKLGATENTIVRYNLSVNDGIEGRSTIVVSCNVKNTQFIGNTIVIHGDTRLMDIVDYPLDDVVPTDVFFRNNIFVADDDLLVWSLFRESENVVFNNNVMCNIYSQLEFGATEETGTVNVKPKFLDPNFKCGSVRHAFKAYSLTEPIDDSGIEYGIKQLP